MKYVLMMTMFLTILLCGCSHGSKLTGTEGQSLSWPCGGDIAVQGQTQGSCTDR